MGEMIDIPTRPQHLFIVRMWSETDSADSAQWRGSVEHVASGRKFYFTSVRDMNDFIALHLTIPNQTSSKEKEKP